LFFFFFSSRRRHTRSDRDWSSDVCSSDLPFSWDRIVERHGHLAAIRESMLVLEGLPSATRLALVAKLSDTLAQFVVAKNWLSARSEERRVGKECRSRAARSH